MRGRSRSRVARRKYLIHEAAFTALGTIIFYAMLIFLVWLNGTVTMIRL